MEDKTTIKKNYLAYFYGYLAIAVIGMVINSYLPVYFLNVLLIPKEEVALVLLFASLILLIKPILSVFFDKDPKYTRTVAMIGSLSLILVFSLLLFTLHSLIMFGIFLACSFALMALVDSAIDKYIIAVSPTEKIKNNNVIWTKIGASIGSILGALIYMMVSSWNLFFILCIIITVPLLFIIFILKKLESTKTKKIESFKDLLPELKSRSILLICLFFVLYSANFLYDWVMEPWVISTYGSGGFSLFNIFLMIWIAIYIIGFIVGRLLQEKISYKSAIIYPMVITGTFFIIGPHLDLMSFLILMTIGQLLAGIVSVNVMSFVLDLSKKKAVLFQFMFSFIIISKIIFTPLGLILYTFLPGEIIITIAGCLYVACVIPLYLNKTEN